MRDAHISVSDVADTVFALGKARYTDTRMLREVGEFVSRNISKATGTDISKLLSGLAWLNAGENTIGPTAAARIASGGVELDRASIANIAGALSRLGYTINRDSVGVWRYIAGLSRRELMGDASGGGPGAGAGADVHKVVTVVWAMAKAGWHPGEEASENLPGTQGEPGGRVLGYGESAGAEAAGKLTALGVGPEAEMKLRRAWFKAAAVCLTRGMVHLEPHELAMVLHAFAVAKFPEDRCGEGGKGGV